MNAFLFVYGTLLKDIRSSIADYLKTESHFTGEGYLCGRMYDLGRYPGVIVDEESPYMVFGHIFELKQPKTSLAVLDHYEAIPDGANATSEYIRTLVEIQFEKKQILCWVYTYNKSVEGLVEIQSGNYLEYLKQNPGHRQFIQSV